MQRREVINVMIHASRPRVVPSRLNKKILTLQPADQFCFALARLEICKDDRSFSALFLCVSGHDFEISAHIRCELSFIDQEQITGADGGSSFARNFIAFSNVDHVDVGIDEFRRERCREIIATTFDEDELEIRMTFLQLFMLVSSRMAV